MSGTKAKEGQEQGGGEGGVGGERNGGRDGRTRREGEIRD